MPGLSSAKLETRLPSGQSSALCSLQSWRAAGSMLCGLKPQDPRTIALAVVGCQPAALPGKLSVRTPSRGLKPMAALREE